MGTKLRGGRTALSVRPVTLVSDLARGRAKRLLRLAYAILSTIPGIPSIYYGDEAGLEGYSDPFNRMPYPYGNEDHSLIAYYRRLGKLRRDEDAYKDGVFKLHIIEKELLVFSREKGGVALVTVVNNSRRRLSVLADRALCVIDPYSDFKASRDEITLDELRCTVLKVEGNCKLDFIYL